jgi:hypothetical protein
MHALGDACEANDNAGSLSSRFMLSSRFLQKSKRITSIASQAMESHHRRN